MEPLTDEQMQLIEDQFLGEEGVQPYIQEAISSLLYTIRHYRSQVDVMAPFFMSDEVEVPS